MSVDCVLICDGTVWLYLKHLADLATINRNNILRQKGNGTVHPAQ